MLLHAIVLHNLVETHEAPDTSEAARNPRPSLQITVWEHQGQHEISEAISVQTDQSHSSDCSTGRSFLPSDGQGLW